LARERDFAYGREYDVGGGAVDAIRSRSRTRIYRRARHLNSKLENIASVFEELLEKDFCGFAKFIKITSSFEELLEMLYSPIPRPRRRYYSSSET